MRSLAQGSLPPGPGSTWTTTVTDPNNDQTVINFAEDATTSGSTTSATYNFYETQRQVNQLINGTQTLLATSTHCYNAKYTGCSTATVGSPITQTDAYWQLPNGKTRLSEVTYNGLGLVTDDKEFDYGVTPGAAPGTTHLVREAAISYAALGRYIGDRPGSVKVMDWSSGNAKTLASSTYNYDQGTPIATSGTPQHVGAGVYSGNLTSAIISTTSSTTLTSSTTYYDTGNPYVATDVNGAQTTYVYGSGSCGNSFPTTINEPLSLSRSITWNCAGGITTQVSDENGNNVTSNYTDSGFWRPANVLDQLNYQTNFSYIVQSGVETAVDASLTFNGSQSVSDSRTTVDGFGRPILGQRLQGPGATNYDTVETDYDNMGRPSRSTMPFVAAAGGTSSTAPGVITTRDVLGRPLTITDANGGQVSYKYINNDLLQTTSGGQTFQKQLEYDGLRRLIYVCEITSAAGSGSCGQSNPATGFLTNYTYDALGHLLTMTQNAQPGAIGGTQTRTYAYDWTGRMTSESNPETSNTGANGTTAYAYDTDSTCGTSSGDLVKRVNAAGNVTCYSHDALHRVTQAGNSGVSNTILRKFFYDSKSSYPTGVTVNNGKRQMVEAETFNTSNLNAFVTDEFFSYSKRGEITDVYQATPHSGGYYHTTSSYWATGALESLSGIPGVPAINYGANGTGLDGEGRYTQVTAASGTNPATNVAYSPSSAPNPLGALTGVTFGSGDSDSFAYDANTGQLTAYSFSVNSKTDSGSLKWNLNGTLQQLAIIDNIPGTSDTQTCNYFYDDLGRLGGKDANGYSVDCGTKWQQLFTFDAFGNIAKSGTSTFLPTYSTATNQFTISGANVKYDANGNLLTDNLNNYTWDQNWGNPASINTTNLIYDALGRMVEQQNGSAYTEILYSPVGKTAIMNGQTLAKAFIPLPGGATAIYNSTRLAYYRHSDWLASSRLTSTNPTTPPTSMYSSTAYAPFGEQYATAGTADVSFTGQNSDTASTLYDFTFREHSPSQGRWISPDPAGVAVVDPTNPQSWNRYAYVLNNPLALVDPLGLVQCFDEDGNEIPCITPSDPPDPWSFFCSAQYSFTECGGFAGIYGGYYGDAFARLGIACQGMSPDACAGYLAYLAQVQAAFANNDNSDNGDNGGGQCSSDNGSGNGNDPADPVPSFARGMFGFGRAHAMGQGQSGGSSSQNPPNSCKQPSVPPPANPIQSPSTKDKICGGVGGVLTLLSISTAPGLTGTATSVPSIITGEQIVVDLSVAVNPWVLGGLVAAGVGTYFYCL